MIVPKEYRCPSCGHTFIKRGLILRPSCPNPVEYAGRNGRQVVEPCGTRMICYGIALKKR